MSKLAGERPAFKHREKESPGFVATSLKRATGRRSEATATPAPGPLTPQSPRPEARDSLDRLMMSSARSVTVRRIERDGTFDRGENRGLRAVLWTRVTIGSNHADRQGSPPRRREVRAEERRVGKECRSRW